MRTICIPIGLFNKLKKMILVKCGNTFDYFERPHSHFPRHSLDRYPISIMEVFADRDLETWSLRNQARRSFLPST